MQKKKVTNATPMAGITKVLLTIPEFLSSTGIGRSLFYEEVKAGRIKIIKVGARTLIPATEPMAWVARLSGDTA
ncbi:hypothetical protein ABAZ39_13040 [Azospirillum argentinense]|uniref:AlpA family transcriptional regulator n=1 Tax=Azospirillum argentinense TaxID=2970906 RepID=A0A060DJ29_9PROT|nr:DNA-binding protein [Azospirillum argentinense]AIB12897.1 hypothetical protein ABAZ39_13040 [Azospirillum argentinense]EZQ09644.1 excisionase [Azospirillum argentinense]